MLPAAVRRVLTVLLSLLAGVLLLGAVEIGLRLAQPAAGGTPFRTSTGLELGRPFTRADPELLFRMLPDTRFLGYYRTNRWGYRGAAFEARPAAGTLRMLCTGDSSTFGLGLREDETWPAALQRMLDLLFEQEQACEVLNLGVMAYSSFQNARQVHTDLLALQPDVILLCLTGHNDGRWVSDLSDAQRWRRNQGWAARLSRTALARWLRGPVDSWDVLAGPHVPAGSDGALPRVSPDEFEQNLRDVIAATRAASVELVLMLMPHSTWQQRENSMALQSERVLQRLARALGVPLADARPAFAAFDPVPLFLDNIHPTAEGQRLVARSVLERLLESDRLPAGARRAWVRRFLAALAGQHPGPEGPVGWRAGAPPRLASGAPPPTAPEPPYATGRLLLRAATLEREGQPARAAALRERARLVQRHVAPADPLRSLLQATARSADRPTIEELSRAEALLAFARAAGLISEPVDRRVGRARTLRRRGDAAGALELLDAALELHPASVAALWQRALALEALGQDEASRRACQRVIQLDPDSAPALLALGRQALRDGQPQQAAGLLRRALTVEPALALAHYLLGKALLRQGALDEADAELRTAQAILHTRSDVPQLLERIERLRATREAVSPR